MPGGALAHDGAGYIYALRGSNSTAFWRYDIAGNLWTVMSSALGNVGAGGALAYDGSSYIYAFAGNSTAAFWRYDALGNSWTAMANALGNVASGGSLAFVSATTYVNSATIASQVLGTSIVGDRWDALFWDETLPTDNTDITFEVRASDTLFAADNATLPWTSGRGNLSGHVGVACRAIHAVAGHSDHLGYHGDTDSRRGQSLPLLAVTAASISRTSY